MRNYPKIIQGGMGAGVSNWRLARAVSQLGHLGVVSGTALDQILVMAFPGKKHFHKVGYDAELFAFPRAVFLMQGQGFEGCATGRDVVRIVETYLARPRVCDLGYLREVYRTPDGAIGYRCSAEPVTVYVSKGGKSEETTGKRCLCNALLATNGHPQVRNANITEPGVVTSGNDLTAIGCFLPPDARTYTAADVIAKLLQD